MEASEEKGDFGPTPSGVKKKGSKKEGRRREAISDGREATRGITTIKTSPRLYRRKYARKGPWAEGEKGSSEKLTLSNTAH